jgi:hypothetical protein
MPHNILPQRNRRKIFYAPSSKFERNKRQVALLKDDRDELFVASLGLVEELPDEAALPFRTEPFPSGFVSREASLVSFGTSQQNEVTIPDLSGHPERPALRGRRFEPVDDACDPISPKMVGKGQNPRLVFVGVMGVADDRARVPLDSVETLDRDRCRTNRWASRPFTRSRERQSSQLLVQALESGILRMVITHCSDKRVDIDLRSPSA